MNDGGAGSVSTARIVLFGSEGGFSRPVLERLLTQGLKVTAVVIPDTTHVIRNFPIKVEQPVNPDGLAELAMKNNVSVLRTQNLNDQAFINKLVEHEADILLVACFPLKIPPSIWQLTDVACWNLHPSLLPKYRGPAPLYWQLKNGELETGLTLHEVSSGFDAGDIIARKSLPLPVNPDNTILDEWVAENGVDLYLDAEAFSIQGTGIGCFFDDPVHQALGFRNMEWQSLYHFTVGGAVIDERLQTLPAYS